MDNEKISTGFPVLDKTLAGGFKRGELSVFAAMGSRPPRPMVVGFKDGKPIFNLAAFGGYKSTIGLTAVLKEIAEGRAYGLVTDLEINEDQVRRRLGLLDAEEQG